MIARRERLQGRMLADRLTAILPASDRPVFKAALAGDAGATLATMATLDPSGHAAYIPLALYLTGAPLDALRAAAMQGWVYCHRPMIEAAGPRLLPMLRAAKFPDIATLPEHVEVWRARAGYRRAKPGRAWHGPTRDALRLSTRCNIGRCKVCGRSRRLSSGGRCGAEILCWHGSPTRTASGRRRSL